MKESNGDTGRNPVLPETVEALVQAVHERVYDIPVDAGSALRPDTRYGYFNSEDDEGVGLSFNMHEVPPEASRRGEVAIIERNIKSPDGYTNTEPYSLDDKTYYVFRDGGKLSLFGFSNNVETPDLPAVQGVDEDGRKISLEDRARIAYTLRQRAREQIWDTHRATGEAEVGEAEAQRILREIGRIQE